MAMKASTNELMIEGVLYETTKREFDGGVIAGEIVIEVSMSNDGEDFKSIIPVSYYAGPKTKAGKDNPAYKGIVTILEKAKSLSDPEVNGDYAKADRVRIRNAQLSENMFFAEDRLVSFARIRGSFFDRVPAAESQPKAQFKVKMIVSNIESEQKKIDGDLVETGRLVVTGNVVQYNGSIDEIKFIVQNKKYINAVEKNWNIGDTVAASGIIKMTTEEVAETQSNEDGFGEPTVNIVTRKIKEFIITNGSTGSTEGYDEDEINAARRDRKKRIAELKEKTAEKAASRTKAIDNGF